ncbi:MAG: transporter, phosphonate, periplasmic substrate-binding family protein [Hyphomicrobiales bacterium]|nr:transporter, phosphonate, periplasmic substrate-binding family protein [Hyphomicrobiales bacterium]
MRHLAKKIPLKIAIAEYPHTAAIRNGSIPIEGVEPEFVTVVPQIAAYRRMVRQVEFDVCEIAPTTYMIARAYGSPFVALPIFVTRHFHHGGVLVRPELGIKHPKDLEGKKVGVRAYSVTTGVWTRGIFIDEFGMDISQVTWVVDDEEHVQQLKLPSNVEHAPKGSSLFAMMKAGELAAGFAANAGIGRSGDPAGGWKTEDTSMWPDLFPDAHEREAEWYKRTGIYPMHATIVVKDAVLAEHPWVARSLHDAFETAKQDWLARMASGEIDGPNEKKYKKISQIVGPDPLPYGMEANLPTILKLEDTAWKQGLIPQRVALEDAWIDPLKV